MATKEEIRSRRPTSPHLSIYKPQISSTLSITHRMTGVALFFSLIILSWYLIFYSFFGQCDCLHKLFECICVDIAIKLVSFCFFYHFLNGIRHLFWDVGYGFTIKSVNYSGWLVVVLSLVATVGFWSVVI